MGSDWVAPVELPDLRRVERIALDLETKDNRLERKMGSGWPFADGYILEISVAYHAEGGIRSHYFPLRHPDSQNFDPARVRDWLRGLFASPVKIVTQNGIYDYGWIRAEFGLLMPPSERLDEVTAAAALVDENRKRYSLDALCAWRGLPGKNLIPLLETAAAYDVPKHGRTASRIRGHLWRFPAQLVGPYAETDAVRTLEVSESFDPILDREGTRAAYRLEVDLLPMVLEMRRRGIRIDVEAAERARDLLFQKRDAVFAELSEKLGANVGMAEIGRSKWLAATFDAHGIKYPHTEKGNPSFTAGNTGWMPRHAHWLPRLIVRADKLNNAGANFLQRYVLDHVGNGGRVHAEIHPHRSDEGGTRSFRFSYSSPPLQLMPKHDEEFADLIRGVFLPEEGEVWATPDISQQEFRFITHYAALDGLPRAAEAVARYRDDPDTDFHNLVAEWAGIDRQSAKNSNFAKAYGAGVRKFAEMIRTSESEARDIMERYDRALPFVKALAERCQRVAERRGYIILYDGARRHWTDFVMLGAWGKGTLAPCSLEEAQQRIADPSHPWHGRHALRRVDTHKALNALIQGSAARHTKLWMRACWREGIAPLLQMHDAIELSVSAPEQAKLAARLGSEVVRLEVPMRVDLKFGRNWGDAKHIWEEVGREAVPGLRCSSATQYRSATVELTSEAGDSGRFAGELAPGDVPRQIEPQPVTLADIAAINIGLQQRGIDPVNITLADVADDDVSANDVVTSEDDVDSESVSANDIAVSVAAVSSKSQPTFASLPIVDASAAVGAALSGIGSAPPGPDGSASRPGNGYNSSRGDYGADNGHDSGRGDDGSGGAESADKSYDPIRAALFNRGYALARSFAYTLPGGAVLYSEDRFELAPHLTPSKDRPRKTTRFWHAVNGAPCNGTGRRRVIYHWPAILAAGPGATVYVVEGANKAEPLIARGLLATAAPYHQWGDECVAALAGRHLVYLEDHDHPDEKGRIKAKQLSADAQLKLTPQAMTFRIVPALMLWQDLGRGGNPPHGWDVKDWIEQGGDVTKLLAICERVPAEAIEPIDLWGRFTPPALPADLLPEIIQQFAIEEGVLMGVDPSGVAMAALAVCAAALPDRTQVQVKRHDSHWLEAARLWVGLIGYPSTKKTPIILRAAKPLKQLDADLWREYCAVRECYEALPPDERKRVQRPKQRRLRLEDATIEAAQEVLKDSPDGVPAFRTS